MGDFHENNFSDIFICLKQNDKANIGSSLKLDAESKIINFLSKSIAMFFCGTSELMLLYENILSN